METIWARRAGRSDPAASDNPAGVGAAQEEQEKGGERGGERESGPISRRRRIPNGIDSDATKRWLRVHHASTRASPQGGGGAGKNGSTHAGRSTHAAEVRVEEIWGRLQAISPQHRKP
mgnify:CR=1 FL=1